MICAEFKKTSKKVRNWIQSQPEVKEESITDWMLYRLSEKLPMFKYRQFTRREENATTGADWEWWILTPTGAFGARIQAKRLRSHSNNLDALTYPKGLRTQQKTLLENAKSVRLPAFYAFYCGDRHVSKCSRLYSDGGVYLVDATTVKSKVSISTSATKIPDSAIISWGVPLSCLFCCPINDYEGLHFEERFRRFLYAYFPAFEEEYDSTSEESNYSIGFRDEPPDYIRSLVSDSDQERIGRLNDLEITRQVAGIAVLDLRIYSTLGQ